MLVTLLIPCKDEAEALGPLFDELVSLPALLGPEHFPELLFVDDGSTDGTDAMLQALCSRIWFPARVLALETNRGIGAAIREGVPLAAGDCVVTYDADRPYPLSDIRALVHAIQQGADVATASPWHPGGGSTDLPAHRSLLSRAASMAYRIRLFRRSQGIHTFTCGFRAYRKTVLEDVLPRRDGFVSTAEMMVRALRRKAKVIEIPSVLRARTEGKSKMKALRTTLAHAGLLFFGR